MGGGSGGGWLGQESTHRSQSFSVGLPASVLFCLTDVCTPCLQQQPFQDTLDLPPSLPPSRSRSPSPLPLPPPPRSQEHSTPSVLSEKALGKRRVIDAFEADGPATPFFTAWSSDRVEPLTDPTSTRSRLLLTEVFDPDDIYKTQDDRLPKRAPSPPSSDTDLELQDGWVPPKPVRYIYDAAEEHKQLREEERVREALRSLRLARGLGSSAFADDDPSPPPPPLPPPKPPQEEVVPPSRRLPKGLSQEREMARLLGAAGGTHTPPGGATTRDLDGEGGAAALGRKLSFWRRGGQSVPSHRSASRDSSGLGLGE